MAVLPALGKITNKFSAGHQAVDIANSVGTPIHAPDGGKIIHAGQMGSGTSDAGLAVEILSLDKYVGHRLCHNSKIIVKVGDIVQKGQVVAYMGFTGYTQPDNVPAGSHCHWIMFIQGRRVNGLLYIDKAPVAPQRIAKRGTATVIAPILNVRNAPSTSAAIKDTYKKGQTFNYDSYIDVNGYRWLSYVSTFFRIRRYVAQKNLKTGERFVTGGA